jgi:hypothetical protein
MNYFKDLMWVPTTVQGGGAIGAPIVWREAQALLKELDLIFF